MTSFHHSTTLLAIFLLGFILLAGLSQSHAQKRSCPGGSKLCTNASGQGCCPESAYCHPNKPVCCHPPSIPLAEGYCINPNAKKPPAKKPVPKSKGPKPEVVKPSDRKTTKPPIGKANKKAPPPLVKEKKIAGPTCEICDRHLYGNLSRALGVTGNAVVNVKQAINEFYRCRERAASAGNVCGQSRGSIMIKTGLINGCLGNSAIRNNESSFKKCVRNNF